MTTLVKLLESLSAIVPIAGAVCVFIRLVLAGLAYRLRMEGSNSAGTIHWEWGFWFIRLYPFQIGFFQSMDFGLLRNTATMAWE